MDYLKELSEGWERRDVSSEEYVAALRAEVKRLEGLILDATWSDAMTQSEVRALLWAEAKRIRGEK